MIRSTKHILKDSNGIKLEMLDRVFADYKNDLCTYLTMMQEGTLQIDTFMSSKDIPTLTIPHSNWKQIVYKNASEIRRSTQKRIVADVKRRYKFAYAMCKKNGKLKKFTSKRFKELNIDYKHRIHVEIKNVSITLDSRIIDFQKLNYPESHFNEFVKIKLPYFQETKRIAQTMNLPIVEHKHSLKYKDWKRKNSIQLKFINGNYYVIFFYEKPNALKRTTGKDFSIDQGYNKLISDSEGRHYGTELFDLYARIGRRRRGSKNYKGLLTHKTNLTRHITKQFASQGIRTLTMEDLCNVKHKSDINHKTMNTMQYWSYPTVLNCLQNLSEREGFTIIKVEPAFTSQECSQCGNIKKSNRKGQTYRCKCGNVMDADTNAAINIQHRGIYSSSGQENLIL